MDEWISTEEAAAILGMNRLAVNSLARSGKVRARPTAKLTRNGRPAWELSLESVKERLERMRIELPDETEWIRFPEAAKRLGISRECLYKRIENGYIEAHNFGPPEKHAIFFQRSEIEAHIQHPPRKPREARRLVVDLPEGEIGWLAGIIDGEGSITITRHEKPGRIAWQIRLIVVNRESLADLQSRFGGRVTFRTHTNERWATVQIWQASCNEAAAILRVVRPWLRWKAAQADLAIEFQDHIDSARYDRKNVMPQSVKDWRDAQVKKIQHLNRRGPRQSDPAAD